MRLFCQLLGIDYDFTPDSDTDEDIESYFEFLSLMYHKWSPVNMNASEIDRPLVPTLTISGISTNAAATIVLNGTPKRRDPLLELIKISIRCCWHDSRASV